jgi:hypothetical protein
MLPPAQYSISWGEENPNSWGGWRSYGFEAHLNNIKEFNGLEGRE